MLSALIAPFKHLSPGAMNMEDEDRLSKQLPMSRGVSSNVPKHRDLGVMGGGYCLGFPEQEALLPLPHPLPEPLPQRESHPHQGSCPHPNPVSTRNPSLP